MYVYGTQQNILVIRFLTLRFEGPRAAQIDSDT